MNDVTMVSPPGAGGKTAATQDDVAATLDDLAGSFRGRADSGVDTLLFLVTRAQAALGRCEVVLRAIKGREGGSP